MVTLYLVVSRVRTTAGVHMVHCMSTSELEMGQLDWHLQLHVPGAYTATHTKTTGRAGSNYRNYETMPPYMKQSFQPYD